MNTVYIFMYRLFYYCWTKCQYNIEMYRNVRKQQAEKINEKLFVKLHFKKFSYEAKGSRNVGPCPTNLTA